MVSASMSSRIEAFAQLLTLFIIFIHIMLQDLLAIIRRTRCQEAISTFLKL
mgnify:CR=1 FL=1